MSQPALDLEFDDLGQPTFSVRELADAVNLTLRRGFRDGVWVRGEIEGFQRRNGHAYFSLAEHDGTARATVAVACFAPMIARLRPLLQRFGLRMRDGLSVRIHGHLDFYAPSGRLTLVMDGLDPTFTLGRLAADRDQLLRRLVAEGLLDRNKAAAEPLVPLRVGVVTSRGTAAWHDLVHELERSELPFRLLVADVRVQGERAAALVAEGIRRIGALDVDVLAVIRGGGARSDLAAFDDEGIARAIAACPVPVLTGLGHEVDRAVADEVAHTSLKTPTAVAVHLVTRVRDAQRRAESAWTGVARVASRRIELHEAKLARAAGRAASRARTVEQRQEQRVRAAGERLGRLPQRLTAAARLLDADEARLRALDPARTLARGWSITRRADGTLVREPVEAGAVVVTTVAGGTFASRVEAGP
jgi:exodeoxyribonuclease VII large subunit